MRYSRQAEKFDVHGHKLNGKLTCGENIADLGGVKLALKALVRYLSTLSDPVPPINGLTPLQRFFLAWSQTWRENSKLLKRNFSLTQHYPPLVKKERAIQLVTIDPHGPNELRCNGTLSNIPEFYEVDLYNFSFLFLCYPLGVWCPIISKDVDF